MNIESANPQSKQIFDPYFHFMYENTQRQSTQSSQSKIPTSQQNKSLNKNIDTYRHQIDVLTDRLRELQTKNQSSSEKIAKMGEYERKIVVCTEEIERLNLVVLNISNKLKEAEEKRKTAQAECVQYKQKTNIQVELRRKLAEYEQRIGILSEEIEKSYSPRTIPNTKLSDAEVDTLRRRVKQLSEDNKRMNEYERRISILSGEVERLNVILTGKDPYKSVFSSSIKQKTVAGQAFLDPTHRVCQQRISFLENQAQKLNTVVGWLRQESGKSERKYNELLASTKRREGHSKGKDSQSRIISMSQQIDHLKKTLSKKQSIIKKLEEKSTKQQPQSNSSRQIESSHHPSSSVTLLKHQISELRRQNQELKGNLAQSVDNSKKFNEYQRRLKIFSQEIERLNILLQNKSYQLDTKSKKLIQFENGSNDLASIQLQKVDLAKSNSQLNQKVRQSEDKIKQLTNSITKTSQQYEQLKSKFVKLQKQRQSNQAPQKQDLAVANKQYERRISILSNQIQRLHIEIQSKQKDTYKLQNALSLIQTSRTAEVQKKETKEPDNQLLQAESRVMSLTLQLQRLNIRIQQGEELKKNAEIRCQDQIKQTQALRTRLAHYQEQVLKITQSFQRLNNLINELKAQNVQLKMQLKEKEIPQASPSGTSIMGEMPQYSSQLYTLSAYPVPSVYPFPQE